MFFTEITRIQLIKEIINERKIEIAPQDEQVQMPKNTPTVIENHSRQTILSLIAKHASNVNCGKKSSVERIDNFQRNYR